MPASFDRRLQRLEEQVRPEPDTRERWRQLPVELWRADDFHAWYQDLIATGDPEGLIAQAQQRAAAFDAALVGEDTHGH